MPFHRPVRRRQRLPWLLLKRFMQRLFRLLSRLSRRQPLEAASEAGFVFPTTVLLVLMVTLTAGALTYRAFSRSTQVSLERQQAVIENSATPAIDRAKAKLEYLFLHDSRPKPKVPPSDAIDNLLRATSGNMRSTDIEIQPLPDDIYTLAGNFPETRIDIDGDGTQDNAWIFPADVNGDGQVDAANEFIAYAITVDHLNDGVDFDDDDEDKAKALVARNNPITAQADNPCVEQIDQEEQADETISGAGWSPISGIRTEKTFQVDAFAIDLTQADPDIAVDRPIDTLEFQQIREAGVGNKWGAWFRYDMELGSGPEFNWNGAIHTQGSLFLRNNANAYMISSTASCAYDPEASEITLGARDPDTEYRGQLVQGSANGENNDVGGGGPTVHIENEGDPVHPTIVGFNGGTDTVNGIDSVSDIFVDPLQLHLSDTYQYVNGDSWTEAGNPEGSFPGRIRNIEDGENTNVSLDDVFRADDRYGPIKVYDINDDDAQIPEGVDIGTDIDDTDPDDDELLLGDESDENSYGLDGYWERRAVREGTRFIVGQRLELGNANGWNYSPRLGEIADPPETNDLDPLYPPINLPTTRTGEHYQRKSLRDNLAAVQGMVVYHYETGDGLTPAVCIAATAHPGTYQTIANSRTFRERIDDNDQVMLDFLTGHGTNGWEFDPVNPGAVEMRAALENLANFAGDPRGGAPSFTPVQDDDVHPYPYLAMWGDFSNLRRVIDEKGFNPSSIADQSTLDTAACTLSLLAYNIDAIYKEYDQVVDDLGFGDANFADLQAAMTTAFPNTDPDDPSDDPPTSLSALVAGISENLPAGIPPEDASRLINVIWYRWVVDRDREHGFDPVPDNDCLDELDDLGIAALEPTVCGTQPYYPALYYVFPTDNHDGDGGGSQPANEPFIDEAVDGYTGFNTLYQFEELPDADIESIAATPHSQEQFTLPNPAPAFDGDEAAFVTVWDEDGNNTPNDDPTPDNRPWDLVVTEADGTADAFGVSLLDKVIYSGRENMAIRLLDINVGELMSNNNQDEAWFAGRDGAGIEHFGLTYAFREDAMREDNIVRPRNSPFDFCDDFATEFMDGNAVDEGCSMVTDPDVLEWQDPPLSDDHLISLKPIDYAPDPMRKPYGFRLRNGADFDRGDDEVSGLSFISDNAVAILGDFNLHDDDLSSEEFEDFTVFTFTADDLDGDSSTTPNGEFYSAFYDRTEANVEYAEAEFDSWRPTEVLGDAVYLLSNDFRDGFVEAGYASDAAGINGGENGDFQYANQLGSGLVSFQNMGRLADNNERVPEAAELLREDPNAPENPDNDAPESPIYFDRNGHVYRIDITDPDDINQFDDYDAGDGNDDGFEYFELNEFAGGGGPDSTAYRRNSSPTAAETTINALMISGIVPSRENQTYGGLPNFPRFNEYWWEGNNSSIPLKMAGGFFQLFFSSASTAPFDADAWEPNDAPVADRSVGYYRPPSRIWGYDVALQYTQQPPVASRFVDLGRARSEFYKELPVDDPYIELLRCAENEIIGGQIDPTADCD